MLFDKIEISVGNVSIKLEFSRNWYHNVSSSKCFEKFRCSHFLHFLKRNF